MAGRTSQDAERLAVAYLEALRKVAERDHWAEVHRLPMHNSPKVGARAFALENGCVVLAFKKDVEADFWRGEAVGFDTVTEQVAKRDFDHLVVLYPSMMEDDAALEAVAAEHCARSLASPAWSASFTLATKDLREVRSKLADLLKSNPWLDKTLSHTGQSLGAVEERLSTLASNRAEAEKRRYFETAEDDMERAARYRVEDADERLDRINEHTVELFTKEFVKTYRRQVENAGLAKGEEPGLYRAYPYRIDALLLSNKVSIIGLRSAPQAPGFAMAPSDFARAKATLSDPAGAFVVALDNDARFEAPEARFLAEKIANFDVEDAHAVSSARQAAADLAAAEKEVTSAGRTNPWLEPQSMKLAESLSHGRKVLEKVVADADGLLARGAVLHTEVVRGNLELAPHGVNPVVTPTTAAPRVPDVPARSRRSSPSSASGVRDVASAPAVSAGANAAGATRASAPTVANVPDAPEHVFQEVDYYNFPKSETVRSAEASPGNTVRELAPEPAPQEPSPSVDVELRAKVYDLEGKLSEYERRLYYMDKYTEMIQKQQLDKVKLLRELIRVEGRRNRSRAAGIAGAALLVALLALIPVWPQTLDAIRAFFASLGL